MEKSMTIKIDEVEYIRKDSVIEQKPLVHDGLKYAIVRSRDQGVMAGFVKAIEGRQVVLLSARQLWKWNSTFVLVDLAEYGVVNAKDSKFSCESSQEVVVLEACAVIYCTEKSATSIRSVAAVNCA